MTTEMIENPVKKSEDDLLLDWAVDQNKRIAAELRQTNGKLPEDPKETALLLKAIDGVAKVATTRKRIKIEDKSAASQAEMAKIMAGVYAQVASKNPYTVDQTMGEVGIKTPPRAAPKLPMTIPDPVRVEGETETQPQQMSYDMFIKSAEPDGSASQDA